MTLYTPSSQRGAEHFSFFDQQHWEKVRVARQSIGAPTVDELLSENSAKSEAPAPCCSYVRVDRIWPSHPAA